MNRGPVLATGVLSRRFLLEAVPLLLLSLIPILLYLPALHSPFERDEGVYATIAQGILNGKLPYRDLFDNKPPLIYGWYTLSFLLFGESVWAPRILAAVLLSFTTLSLYGQARLVFRREVALLAAGLFALSTGVPFVALHANTEAYMLLPLVMSLVAFTLGLQRRRLGWFLGAGALCGLAMMTKQVAFWNLLALALVATAWRWRLEGGTWRCLIPAASLLAGAAATIVIVALPFAANGALGDLLYANISYNWLYISVLGWGPRLANMSDGVLFFSAVAAPLVGGAIIGLSVALRRRNDPAGWLLVLWGVASAIGVASGGRYFPHYFLHVLPAMSVLTAVAIFDRLRRRHTHPIGRPAIIVVAALLLVSLAANGVLYIAPSQAEERVADNVFEQKQWESASQALGLYIKHRTAPEDTIFNYGREAQVYFYAERLPAVRYMSDWPYWWDEDSLGETIQALRLARPAYIIDSAQPPLFDDYNKYHPQAFKDFLAQDYEYVGKIYFATVYKLKGRP